ncbi:MAG: alpha/beta fold hydrolase [Gammaproteobacteria bacterium]|nr:alpha/beta fold hydrolase [Gammaproteobacteria bacterium]MDH5800806.1 alpha/beta fold hydrolase [Gammaproteobacteria bacterium]
MSDFNESRGAQLHLYDGLEDAPCTGENFLIQGPAGVLEALMSQPANPGEVEAVAVICHPHPLHGGSMANKVVHIVSNALNDLGVPTLRFNFRGVGHSQGRFDRGQGEVEDLEAVCDWLRSRYPQAQLWLAGFSFGAFVAFNGYRDVGAERLLLIAPPVTLFDFPENPVEIPWLVIQGGKDDVIAPEKVSAWVQQQRPRPNYQWFADADHFFHGRLNQVREAVKQQWS